MIVKGHTNSGLVILGACLFCLGFVGCGTYQDGRNDSGTAFLAADGSIVVLGGRDGQLGKKKSGKSDDKAALDYWWRPEGATGSPSITISLGEQKAYFKKGGTVVGMAPISSGREGYGTPTGNFSVTQKSRDHASNLYGDYVNANGEVVVSNVGVRRDPRPSGTTFRGAPMPYFLRIVGAVGMHAGYLPGYPASHGCIRLPEEMAHHFFENSQHGTPVIVTR